MALTFADTYNMIAFLTKLDVSKGFEQTNDVVGLQALIDRKKVLSTEDTIRQALRLDDDDSIDYLPNEEIFAELARIGYEKPSTKLTFYKAFFSAQWKFLIYTILQCMSTKRTAWNEFSSSMASAVICLATGRKFNFSKYIFDSLVRNVDSPSKFYMYPRFLKLMINAQTADLSSHNTKYTSPALTQKVFANIRRVDKGLSGVDTLLFDGMLVPQQVQDDVADAAEEEDVANEISPEPTPPSPTPATTPPPQQELIPSSTQVESTRPPLPYQSPIAQPSSPSPQQPPSHDAEISMALLNQFLETCATLTKKVSNLEQDKIAQAIEITKLKQRVKSLEKKRKLKALGFKRLRKETDEAEPAECSKKKKGLIIQDPEKAATASLSVQLEDEAFARELKAELNANIIRNEVIEQVKRKEKQDNTVMRYQDLKRKPITEAHAKKNIIVYLKNMAGFKMDFFKEIEEEDSKRKSENLKQKAAKKQKIDEEVEELKTHLQIVPNDEDDVYTKATPLALEMILLVERRYPLTRFTLEQMLNNVRLEVEEESDVSLELLRFVRRQQQEGYKPELKKAQEKDKIESKQDKNGKRSKAGKCQK
nr:hypothetical protein [Tanacetum cinerariifolium]